MSVDADIADLRRLAENVHSASAPTENAAATLTDNALWDNAYGVINVAFTVELMAMCEVLRCAVSSVSGHIIGLGNEVNQACDLLEQTDRDNADSFGGGQR